MERKWQELGKIADEANKEIEKSMIELEEVLSNL